MKYGNIEIQKWQEEGFYCACITFKISDPLIIKEQFISSKTKTEFNREIERVLHTGFDSVLH
ncbi:MAG: hypothetical protein ACTSQI_09635 [Candidatus Helarchaeota archaeon]